MMLHIVVVVYRDSLQVLQILGNYVSADSVLLLSQTPGYELVEKAASSAALPEFCTLWVTDTARNTICGAVYM